MRQEINKAVYKGVTNWKATPLVILFGRCMLERQTASIFWLYFNRTCQRVIASNQVYPYLYRVMLDIMKPIRRIPSSANWLLPLVGMAFTRTIGGNGAEKGRSIP